jgi:hypothetical protein
VGTLRRRYSFLLLPGLEIRFPRRLVIINDYIVTAASNETNHCQSNSSDKYYYYGDNDGYYSNDSDNDNDISLTKATNEIYGT